MFLRFVQQYYFLGYRYLSPYVSRGISTFTGEYGGYVESALSNGLSFAIMPQYYVLSTLASNGVYYGCKYSGLDKFETIEAVTQLCADQVCYRYAMSDARAKVFDEKYFYQLNSKLASTFGTEAASWLTPAVHGLDYANAELNRIIASPLESLKPYFSANTFETIKASLPELNIKLDGLPYSESFSSTLAKAQEKLSPALDKAQTVQEYVKNLYQKRQMLEERAFNYIEESVFEQMENSIFKAERLYAIQLHRSNALSFDIYNLENTIENSKASFKKVGEELKRAKAELDDFTTSLESETVINKLHGENISAAFLKSKVLKAQFYYDYLSTTIESSQNTLTEKQEALIDSRAKEEALFKETEGFAYYSDWQDKFVQAKVSEFDRQLSAAEVEAFRLAEQEALGISRFHNTDATNEAAQLWGDGVNALYDSHKDNFLDTTNIPNTMQGVINYAFDNMRGKPNDRNDMSKYFADMIIRYKHPLYPEVGDKAVIEVERDTYFKHITNNLMDNYNKKKGSKLRKCRNRVEDYITSEILEVSVEELREQGLAYKFKDGKHSFWNHVKMTFANEVVGKFVGRAIYPYYKGNGEAPGRGNGSFGIQYNQNFGGGYNFKMVVNNQPVVTIYDSTKKDTGYTLTLPSKSNAPVYQKNTLAGHAQPSIAAENLGISGISKPEGILPGLSPKNPYVQDALAHQRELMFVSQKSEVQANESNEPQSMLAASQSVSAEQKQTETKPSFLTQVSYGARYLKGDRSPEILDWQRRNREATSPSVIAVAKGIKAPVGPALKLAVKDLAGAINGVFNAAKSCVEQSEELAGSKFATLGPGMAVGCSLATIKATKVLGTFIGEEAARIALDEKLESTKFIRDTTNEFIASYEKMDSYERSREILRFIFSIGLAGPALKTGTQAVKVGGNVIVKAGDVASKLPIPRYQFRSSTLAKRPVLPAHEAVAEPLISKYSELVATKAPDTGRTLRASTLAKRDASMPLTFSNQKQINTDAKKLSVSEFLAQDAKALDMYDKIRMSEIDVRRISKNMSLPEFQVRKVKDHIFYNKHDLGYERARFDPDINIAEAWLRLEKGTYNNADLKIFNHELFEAKFEGIFKESYEASHNAANRSGRTSGLNPKEEAIYGSIHKNKKSKRK